MKTLAWYSKHQFCLAFYKRILIKLLLTLKVLAVQNTLVSEDCYMLLKVQPVWLTCISMLTTCLTFDSPVSACWHALWPLMLLSLPHQTHHHLHQTLLPSHLHQPENKFVLFMLQISNCDNEFALFMLLYRFQTAIINLLWLCFRFQTVIKL